jgi:hypothetical protein
VPYHYHPTLRSAMGSHIRMLKQLGRPVPARNAAANAPANVAA